MKIHHIALIVSDLDRSLKFYTELLGFNVIHQVFREERQSHKVDLKNGEVRLEIFTFPETPQRASHPEALGLRHMAFGVTEIEEWHMKLSRKIEVESIRLDPITGKRFFFFPDPDNQPIEIYEN